MKYALFSGCALLIQGCISVNSPLFPPTSAPIVLDRACPQSMSVLAPTRDTPPEPTPVVGPIPGVTVPKLESPQDLDATTPPAPTRMPGRGFPARRYYTHS